MRPRHDAEPRVRLPLMQNEKQSQVQLRPNSCAGMYWFYYSHPFSKIRLRCRPCEEKQGSPRTRRELLLYFSTAV